MPKHQEPGFHRLLRHVWQYSAFYRDYYGSHGIKERELADVQLEDLPFLTKRLLMENFDRAVCDPRLRKTELEQWLQDDSDPGRNYKRDFIVVHSSGSSGNMGIFVYDSGSWRVANACMAGLFPATHNPGKTKIAFYVVPYGHFASVTVASRIPQARFEVSILSLLDFSEQVAQRLNTFQPDRLVGYSSSIASLAEMALHGSVRIRPESIFVSGDLLTPSMEKNIRRAWDVPLYIQYSASESMYIAFKEARDQDMTIIADLNIVEMLDNDNRGVETGRQGRVVLTNLYNYTLPILRYELGDHAVRGTDRDGSFPTIREIKGRVNQPLPIVLDNDVCDTISTLLLGDVPGTEKMQYISRGPRDLEILYVAPVEMDAAVRNEFQRILNWKRASRMTFRVRRVAQIGIDAKTGKFALVKVESLEPRRVSIGQDAAKQEPLASDDHGSDSFCEFTEEEIERSISERFEQIAGRFAGRTAVKTTTASLTYHDLNAAANRLAHTILTISEAAQAPVGLLLDHDEKAIAGVLGVLKAGKICVPLDPSSPSEFIRRALQDTEVNVTVTNTKRLALAAEVIPAGCRLIDIEKLDPNLSIENPAIPVSSADLAYILYSSGSTGRAKGIMHSHRDLLHAVMASGNPCRYSPEDRMSLFASISSGHGGMTIFSALLYGAALYLWNIREQGLAHLADWLIREEVTIYLSSPSVFRSFAAMLSAEHCFPKLRLIRVGSEALKQTDVELYKSHFSPTCILVHILASAEAMHVANYFMDKTTPVANGAIPVGFPVEGKKILLLDENGRELGSNETGEIAVKSNYLFPGYWRNAELTQSVLWPDPAGQGGKIYRTGDMGRLSSDGCLTFLGRKDSRVKIRGYGVDLAEIETTLLRHPTVKEAVVVLGGDGSEERRLLAYVTTKDGDNPDVSELRDLVKEHFPDYMVPSAFVTLDSLPLTPNGKVDRTALPSIEPSRPDLAVQFTAPRTPIQSRLAEIWRELLGVERIGIHDNFFDLGGHSLLAAQVISRVHDVFQVDLPLASMLMKPTVADVAIAIVEEQARRGELGEALVELEQLSDEEALRLLSALKPTANR